MAVLRSPEDEGAQRGRKHEGKAHAQNATDHGTGQRRAHALFLFPFPLRREIEIENRLAQPCAQKQAHQVHGEIEQFHDAVIGGAEEARVDRQEHNGKRPAGHSGNGVDAGFAGKFAKHQEAARRRDFRHCSNSPLYRRAMHPAEYHSRTASRPRAPCPLRFVMASAIFCARSRGSPGRASQPQLAVSISSGTPPTAVETTGKPAAMASRTLMGRPSLREASTNASTRDKKPATSGLQPRNVTTWPRPSPAAKLSRSACSSPEPRISSRHRGICRYTRAKAANRE